MIYRGLFLFTCTYEISVRDVLNHRSRKRDLVDPEKRTSLWLSTWTYLNILSYFQHGLEPLPLQGGETEREATARKQQKGLQMAWGHKFIKGVDLLSFSAEKAKSHNMDPRKWGQRLHTYLSSFLEGSFAKFKERDECH